LYKDRNNFPTQTYEEFKIIHGVKKITGELGLVINNAVFSLTVRKVPNTD